MGLLQNIARAGGSGFVGGLLGWPADTLVAASNLARAGYGYGGHKLGLLDPAQMPDTIEPGDVPLTSSWISKKLGVGDTTEEAIAEFVGGLLSPGPKMKAPNKLEAIKSPPQGTSRVVASPKLVKHKDRYQSGDKEGIYRGSEAFGGITPAKLGGLRRGYLSKMEEGTPGRLWYDEASEDIYRLVGKDSAKADELANMMAVLSAGTPVNSNTMYAFKGWNQRLAGEPLNTGKYPTAMGKSIEDVLSSPEATASGLKRSPFSAGLSVKWRGVDHASRPVHDIHDARAWGLRDPKTGRPWEKGIGEAGHRFLDEQGDFVTKRANEIKLGGVDDWLPYRSQAAAWVAQKARKEGKQVSETSKHYGDFIPDYSAQITRSWVPGNNTGHFQELLSRPVSEQKQFSDLLEAAVSGEGGIDKIANKLGALTDRTLPNAGLYEGIAEPGFASQVMIGKTTGKQAVDPASRRVLDAVAATHGLLGVQKQSAWNAMLGKAPQGKAGGLLINTGSPANLEELRGLQGLLSSAGADIAQVDPRGARALIFDPLTKEQAKSVKAAAKSSGGKAEFRTVDSHLFPADENFNAPANWSARPYVDLIEAGGPNIVSNWNKEMPAIAAAIRDRALSFGEQYGLTASPWFKPMMDGIERGGLDELKRLVKAGIVPVAVLSVFGLSALDDAPVQ